MFVLNVGFYLIELFHVLHGEYVIELECGLWGLLLTIF